MGSDARVRISSAGARALLTSAAVQADIGARAIAIATAACRMTSPDEMRNAPFMADGDAGGSRARARVFAATPHGVNANNGHNTLLRSLDAGR